MQENLANFIHRRRRELDSQRRSLLASLQAIDDELDDLKRAEDIVRPSPGLQVTTPAAPPVEGAEDAQSKESVENTDFAALQVEDPGEAIPTSPIEPRKRAARATTHSTIKQAVLFILSEHPNGLSANDMLPFVNQRLGINYPRSSLSPQLSRLKSDGFIKVNRKVWRLMDGLNAASESDPKTVVPDLELDGDEADSKEFGPAQAKSWETTEQAPASTSVEPDEEAPAFMK